jgi:hypothetical protein
VFAGVTRHASDQSGRGGLFQRAIVFAPKRLNEKKKYLRADARHMRAGAFRQNRNIK